MMNSGDNNEARNNEPAVVIQDLRKSFGRQKVLDGIGLQVANGETVVVLGRSGTGKSVLLKLLIGLQKADSGSIRVQGREITTLHFKDLNQVRGKIGFLFQQAALYDSLSIEENVAFPLDRHSDLQRGERKERVRALLETVGMEQHGKKLPSQISGGMKKRVGLARALALEPEIMLFDEPTAGLDPITAAEINQLILGLQEKHKITSIIVTHDIRGARTVSHRLVLLNEGSIVAEGTFEELKKNRDPFVAQFLLGDL
ncbi:MAG: ATP-binding cassette domain-containing protein [Acidobacteria bacterium]|nr:ATP-binding cassette domain-containing protein [Acidobacteriota bacterium]